MENLSQENKNSRSNNEMVRNQIVDNEEFINFKKNNFIKEEKVETKMKINKTFKKGFTIGNLPKQKDKNSKFSMEKKNEINNNNNDNNICTSKHESSNAINSKSLSKSFKIDDSSVRLKLKYEKRRKILQMNYFNYCWSKICKKDLNRQKEARIFLFDKSREFIEKKLDLFKYLKNLQHMKIIIDLLTNREQKTALKYMSMPCLNTENFDIIKRDFILNQNCKYHDKMIDYFREKNQNESMTDFDLKILDMLKKRFSKI